MNRIQRDTIAFQMKENGAKLREIGEYFGVSTEQARQYIKKHKRREEYATENTDRVMPDIVKEMACSECKFEQIKNVLLTHGIKSADDIVAMGPRKLLKLKNFGRVSLAQVVRTLIRLGKIKSLEDWDNESSTR